MSSTTYLFRRIIINAELKAISGIHIGSSSDAVQIGGIDNPVIRRKDNGQPYLPGSSIKGKMRSLLEEEKGIKEGSFHHDGGAICDLFGALDSTEKDNKAPIHKGHPSRLIVRDAYMTTDTISILESSPFVETPYTEVKFENTIDREKGIAINPRQTERIPAGAKFNLEFIIKVYAENPEMANERGQSYLKTFEEAIELLNNDYLGGNGSRGYGQVYITCNLYHILENSHAQNTLAAQKAESIQAEEKQADADN